MKISLKFIQNRLFESGIRSDVQLNHLRNPFFDSFQIFAGQTAREGTLYLCPPDTPRDVFRGMKQDNHVGLVWFSGTAEPPKHLPILLIRESDNRYEILNQIADIFSFFHTWGDKVRQYMLEKRSLPEIFELLDEVTPNPWYLCDCSFRMQVIRKDPDMEDMSAIWRYQYRHGHHPIQLILGMEENGLLDLMNKMRRAFIVSEPAPFGFTFVSKAITYSKGLLGHFYILGTYTKLSEYEVEIAEFFGNALAKMLSHDSSYLPTLGRFYDGYFVDLIEGFDPKNLKMLESVFQKISWDAADTFCLAVLGRRDSEALTKSMLDLEIQVLESKSCCKAFLYREQVVVIINSSRIPEAHLLSPTERAKEQIQSVLQDFGSTAGISEMFSGQECFEHLQCYYRQARTALSFALEQEAAASIRSYSEIAVPHLCRILIESGSAPVFSHPAVEILIQYDKENRTELARTLYQYLLCGENVVRTARELYILRNSLMYRLDKIHQLTGADLSSSSEKVRLFLTYHIFLEKKSE